MNNYFDKIFSGISGLFNNQKGTSVLGIDIGSSSIKVVQIMKKNNVAVLQTYGEIALGPYAGIEVGRATKLDTAKLTEATIDVLKEANTSTDNSALSIPMSTSMVSVIEMPGLKMNQLNQMIPIEARKYIPVPISEVTLDWFVIPNFDENFEDDKFEEVSPNKNEPVDKKSKKIETMIVAIHNDTLSNYSSIVRNANLKASFFEIEMFSTTRAVLDPGYLSPVMIIDIGAGATKVYITERQIVRVSHNVGRGSQDLSLNIARSMNIDVSYAEKLKRTYGRNDPEKDNQISILIDGIFNPIFADANKIVLEYQRKNHKNISKIIMVGGGSLLAGITDKAQKYFSVETELGLPFDKLQTPAFLDPVLKKTGVMFAGAIGLALRKLQELE